MKLLFLALAFAAASAPAPAPAQTVWRCGADGRTYSDAPCPEGRVVAAADARSGADVQAAREIAARERRLANELVREGHERDREAAARGNGLAGIVTPTAPKADLRPKKASKQHPPAAPDTFRATAPASRRAAG